MPLILPIADFTTPLTLHINTLETPSTLCFHPIASELLEELEELEELELLSSSNELDELDTSVLILNVKSAILAAIRFEIFRVKSAIRAAIRFKTFMVKSAIPDTIKSSSEELEDEESESKDELELAMT